MKTGIRIGTMGVLAAGLLVGQVVLAEGGGKGKGKGAGEATDSEIGRGIPLTGTDRQGGAEREKMRAQMRERMEKNRQARKQLMEAVRAEEDAQKALTMVREHCVSQHAERAAFHQEMMEEKLAKVGERLEGSEMDTAKREEMLKQMVKNMEERKAKAEAQYAELLANLDALAGKEDLTKADILGALQASRPEMKHDRDGKRGKERGEEMKRKRSGDGAGEMKRKRQQRPVEPTDV